MPSHWRRAHQPGQVSGFRLGSDNHQRQLSHQIQENLANFGHVSLENLIESIRFAGWRGLLYPQRLWLYGVLMLEIRGGLIFRFEDWIQQILGTLELVATDEHWMWVYL